VYQLPTNQGESVKPTTPGVTNYTTLSTTTTSDSTPEKLVMNDSGIDIISPQLNAAQSQVYLQPAPSAPLHQIPAIVQNEPVPELPIRPTAVQKEDDNDEDESDSESDETIDSNKENETSTTSENAVKSGSGKSTNRANPSKPPKPYLEIIADAVLSCNVKMMQLHEIYTFMELKYEYFAKNVNKSWRNSVRHNLSLNECFVKAGRGSNGKGNYWKIHQLCEKEFIRGNFRRKSFKQLIRAGSGGQNQAIAATHAQSYPAYASTAAAAQGEYTFNYRSISSMIPPPLPQNLNNAQNLASFQYPTSNEITSLNYESSSSSSTSNVNQLKSSQPLKSNQRYQPY
jgi:hypothetical protein